MKDNDVNSTAVLFKKIIMLCIRAHMCDSYTCFAIYLILLTKK